MEDILSGGGSMTADGSRIGLLIFRYECVIVLNGIWSLFFSSFPLLQPLVSMR